MTGVAFEVTFDDVAVLAGLDRLQAGLVDTQPLLFKIGAWGVDTTKRRFLDQAGPDGAAWAPLQQAYADLKAAMGDSSDIMRLHDDLMNSQHYVTELNAVSWGSSLPYAAQRQWGGRITAKNQPALTFALFGIQAAYLVHVQSVTQPGRPYLGLSAVDRDEIVNLTRDYVLALI